jgi:hypothetical protein
MCSPTPAGLYTGTLYAEATGKPLATSENPQYRLLQPVVFHVFYEQTGSTVEYRVLFGKEADV